MQTVVIIIHLIIVLALIGVVLLQRSEGGLGLGGGGGGGVSGFMTGRGQTNALTRATAVLATVFFLTSMVLSWMATQIARRARSSTRLPRRRRPISRVRLPAGRGPAFSSSFSACRAVRRGRAARRRLPAGRRPPPRRRPSPPCRSRADNRGPVLTGPLSFWDAYSDRKSRSAGHGPVMPSRTGPVDEGGRRRFALSRPGSLL